MLVRLGAIDLYQLVLVCGCASAWVDGTVWGDMYAMVYVEERHNTLHVITDLHWVMYAHSTINMHDVL